MDGIDGITGGRKDGWRGRPSDGSAGPPVRRPVVIPIHVQPRAARTEVVGMHGDAVKIRLKAPPVDGAANDELLRFVARRLEVPRADVELAGGATARGKRVRVITSLSAAELMRTLTAGAGS